jgi:hypothetical protein
MRIATKLLGLALPIATAITLGVLLVASALPQVGQLPDLIAHALELAVRTMYALAIGGSAALSMHLTGMDVPNAHRAALRERAEQGSVSAMIVLASETLAWLAWAAFWAVVYLR